METTLTRLAWAGLMAMGLSAAAQAQDSPYYPPNGNPGTFPSYPCDGPRCEPVYPGYPSYPSYPSYPDRDCRPSYPDRDDCPPRYPAPYPRFPGRGPSCDPRGGGCYPGGGYGGGFGGYGGQRGGRW